MNNIEAKKYNDIFIGKEINNYKIEKAIGFGKSAIVFQGNSQQGKHVAIKIFDLDLVSKFGYDVQLARLKRELSLINHNIPNMVNILGGGVVKEAKLDYFYIIMEMLHGINLKQLVENRGAQCEAFVKRIFKDLFITTESLLKRKIVHRDVKPANILIDEGGKITLMDLGVMKYLGEPSLTDSGIYKPFIATLRYAPPELLLRKEGTSIRAWRAINLYQIAAVCHDLIMGHEIFNVYSEPYAKLVLAIMEKVPIIRMDGYGRGFIEMISNLLSKEWEQRLSCFNPKILENNVPKTSRKNREEYRSYKVGKKISANDLAEKIYRKGMYFSPIRMVELQDSLNVSRQNDNVPYLPK
jgi:serine/threonine-protein kinase